MNYIECEFYKYLSAKDRFNNRLYKDSDTFCLNVEAIRRFYAKQVALECPPYEAELVDAVEIELMNDAKYIVLMSLDEFKKLLEGKRC